MGAKLFRVLLTLSILVFFSMSAMARDIYVDGTNGSNVTGDGTTGKPLASIDEALNGTVTAFANSVVPVANDIIILKAGTYKESITIPATANLTIKAASGAAVIMENTLNTAGPVVTLNSATSSGFILDGIAVVSGTNHGAANPLISVSAAVTDVNIQNCTITPGYYADIAINIDVVGTVSGWRIENNTFDLTNQTDSSNGDVGIQIALNLGVTLTNTLVSNNTFSGPSNRNANPVLITENVTAVNTFKFTGNVVTRARCEFRVGVGANYNSMDINGNIFDDSESILFKNILDDDLTDDNKLFTEGPNSIYTNIGTDNCNIQGNHFGSSTSDGSILYAVVFQNFDQNDIQAGNIHINYNSFQFPNTTGTMASTDMTSLNGHVSVLISSPGIIDNIGNNAALQDATIDAKFNWWGDGAGAKTAYEISSIAVRDVEFDASQHVYHTNKPPLIDNTSSAVGIAIRDYDEDGFIDRAVVHVKVATAPFLYAETIDPASLNYTGWSIAGFEWDTAKTPRVNLDNDRDLAPDGLTTLTLFITEGSSMDTGEVPQITYASGTLTGITGNADAKLAAITNDTITENDKAKPVIVKVETKDADTDGLFPLIIPRSASMDTSSALVISSSQYFSLIPVILFP